MGNCVSPGVSSTPKRVQLWESYFKLCTKEAVKTITHLVQIASAYPSVAERWGSTFSYSLPFRRARSTQNIFLRSICVEYFEKKNEITVDDVSEFIAHCISAARSHSAALLSEFTETLIVTACSHYIKMAENSAAAATKGKTSGGANGRRQAPKKRKSASGKKGRQSGASYSSASGAFPVSRKGPNANASNRFSLSAPDRNDSDRASFLGFGAGNHTSTTAAGVGRSKRQSEKPILGLSPLITPNSQDPSFVLQIDSSILENQLLPQHTVVESSALLISIAEAAGAGGVGGTAGGSYSTGSHLTKGAITGLNSTSSALALTSTASQNQTSSPLPSTADTMPTQTGGTSGSAGKTLSASTITLDVGAGTKLVDGRPGGGLSSNPTSIPPSTQPSNLTSTISAGSDEKPSHVYTREAIGVVEQIMDNLLLLESIALENIIYECDMILQYRDKIAEHFLLAASLSRKGANRDPVKAISMAEIRVALPILLRIMLDPLSNVLGMGTVSFNSLRENVAEMSLTEDR